MNQLPPPNWGMPVNIPQFRPGFPPFRPPFPQAAGHLSYAPQLPHFMPGAFPHRPTTPHNMVPSGERNYQTNQPNNYQSVKDNSDNTMQTHKPPSSDPAFTCDACSKGFNSREALNAHLNLHEMCDQDGCTFKASRKGLKLHYIQIHAKGKARINLDTPEEIAKWRQERKRNFPTAANIAKKMALLEQRKANGQILETTQYSYRGHGRGRGRGRGRWQRRYQSRGRCGRSEPQHNASPAGDPLAMVLDMNGNQCGSVIEDEEDALMMSQISGHVTHTSPHTPRGAAAITHVTQTVPQASGTSALSVLCASYGDMSSDDDDDQTVKSSESLTRTPKVNTNTDFPKPQAAEQSLVSSSAPNHQIRKRPRSRNKKQPTMTNTKRNPTLLEMLLAPEIRHERNIILQCLRYVVKKDFFQENKSS